jgi:hypothetical protein
VGETTTGGECSRAFHSNIALPADQKIGRPAPRDSVGHG